MAADLLCLLLGSALLLAAAPLGAAATDNTTEPIPTLHAERASLREPETPQTYPMLLASVGALALTLSRMRR